MELVLADTLLSQCPDAGALLRAICGEDRALPVERVETLHLVLRRVAAAAEGGGWRGEARRLAWDAALSRCLPVLLCGGSGACPEERLRLERAACGALRCCASLGGAPLAERLAQEALAVLEACGAGRLRGETTASAVEVLTAVAPWLEAPALLERTVGAALALLRGSGEEEETQALLVAGRLLPALGRNSAALGRVWEGVIPLASGDALQPVSRTLLVLSALADVVLPTSLGQDGGSAPGEAARLPDARLFCGFWKVVQEGLTASDALCRKRACYLLKRAVDVSDKLRAECRCSPDAGNGTCLAPLETDALCLSHKCNVLWRDLISQLLQHGMVMKRTLPVVDFPGWLCSCILCHM